MRKTQRLDKILSNFGYGTRSEIKGFVKEGIIFVDGQIVKDSGMHVDPETSEIKIQDEILHYREFIYVIMNKPQGVISATFDKKLPIVVDLLPDHLRCFELFPVGRLDIDTEGLLILTNDGKLSHSLLSPKKHVSKEYYALVEGVVTEEDILSFKEGVVLDDDYKTMPAELTILESGEISKISLVIYEGKFHQVKRMFEAVGKKVTYLKRIKMGGLVLDESIPVGSCREMTTQELEILTTREEE